MRIFKKPPSPQPFWVVDNMLVPDVDAGHMRLFCTPRVRGRTLVIFARSYIHVLSQFKKKMHHPPSLTLPLPIIPYSSDWPKLTTADLDDSLDPS